MVQSTGNSTFAAAAPVGALLVRVSGPQGVQSPCQLQLPVTAVGGHPDNDIPLPGRGVGRYHLQIAPGGDAVTLTDLGTGEQTLLDGSPLSPFARVAWLPGQALQIGDYQLDLVPATAADTSPPNAAVGAAAIVAPEHLALLIDESEQTLLLTTETPASVRMTLVNNDPLEDDQVQIAVVGVPQRWHDAPQSLVALPRGQAEITLTINVPAESASEARLYPVSILIRSQSRPQVEARAEMSWIVAPFAAGRLTIVESRRTAWRRAKFTAVLHNSGNATNVYRLSAEPLSSTLEYDFDQDEIEVARGGRAEATMFVRAFPRTFGNPDVHQVQLQAQPERVPGAPLAAQAQLIHRAFLTPWLLILLVCLMLLGLFSALWGYALLGYNTNDETLQGLGYGAWLKPTEPKPGETPPAPTESPTPTLDATQAAAAEATKTWQAGDDDHDGLANAQEATAGTDPEKRDTDNDGIDDAEELTRTPATGPNTRDTDHDGIPDGDELGRGMNPNSSDSDGDKIPDAQDPDPLHPPTFTPTNTPTPSNTATPTDTPTNTPTPNATNLAQASVAAATQNPGGTSGAGSTGGTTSTSPPPTATATPTATNTPTPLPNRAPVITISGKVAAKEGTPVSLEDAGLSIAVSDPDAGSKLLLVTLKVIQGVLTDPQSGTQSSTPPAFEATANEIGARIGQYKYQWNLDTGGADTLTVIVNDRGYSRSDGSKDAEPQPDPKQVSIVVADVNDPPSIGGTLKLGVVREGTSATVTKESIHATDPDDSANALKFTITDMPSHGDLLLGDQKLKRGSVFTQQQVDDGLLVYSRTDSADGSDRFKVTVRDSDEAEASATLQIGLSTNHAPSLTIQPTEVTWNQTPAQGTSRAVEILKGVTITDSDSPNDNLRSATITITNLKNGEDEKLTVIDNPNISKDFKYSDSKLVLSLQGEASITEYQAVLQSITYDNTDSSPDATTRDVEVVVTDVFGKKGNGALTITITSKNDLPKIVLDGDPVEAYEEDGDPIRVNSGATIDDDDVPGNYNGGSLLVTAIVTAGDANDSTGQVSVDETNGSSFKLNESSPTNATLRYKGKIIGTVSGENTPNLTIVFTSEDAKVDVVGELISRITYRSTEQRFAGGQTYQDVRTISFILSDGTAEGAATPASASQKLTIKGENDAPELTVCQARSFNLDSIVLIRDLLEDLNNCYKDVDEGAMKGIAVTGEGSSVNNEWEYCIVVQGSDCAATSSGNWKKLFQSIGGDDVRVLAADDKTFIRYNSITLGDKTLVFYAWDQYDIETNGHRVSGVGRLIEDEKDRGKETSYSIKNASVSRR